MHVKYMLTHFLQFLVTKVGEESMLQQGQYTVVDTPKNHSI